MGVGLVYGCMVPHPPVLVPAIAGRRLDQVQLTREAMRRIADEIVSLSPDAVVVVSPHAPIIPTAISAIVAGRYAGGFEPFGVSNPEPVVECFDQLAGLFKAECGRLDVPCRIVGRPGQIHHMDHGAAVPLHFLQEAGFRGSMLLVAFSDLAAGVHRRCGMALAAAADASGARIALVASGDLSHRLFPGAPAGYSPSGRLFDDAIVAALERGDYQSIIDMDEEVLREAGECGHRSLVIALGAFPDSGVQVLSYEGPFGVGYLVARFPGGTSMQCCDAMEEAGPPHREPRDETMEALRLARQAVEGYVRQGRVVELPTSGQGLLGRRAGVFVSLKIDGALRGCIGTVQPMQRDVAAEIIHNAIAAATRDPRFRSVSEDDLPHLQYSVDIVSGAEPVEGLDQLDPERFGVIVQSGSRRGLLLPALEGVATVQQQIAIARRKAGISEDAILQVQRFTVMRFREKIGG